MSTPPLTTAGPAGPAGTGGEAGRAPGTGPASTGASAAAPGARAVTAVVVGHDRSGAAILHSEEGRLTLASAARLAVGSSVTLLVKADGTFREVPSRALEAAQPGNTQPRDALPASVRSGIADDAIRLGVAAAGGSRAAALPAGTVLQVEILQRILQQGGEASLSGSRGTATFAPGDTLVLRTHAATTADGRLLPTSQLPADFLAKVTAGVEGSRLTTSFGTFQIEKSPAPEAAGVRIALRLLVSDPAPTAAQAGALAAAAGNRGAEPAVLSKAWPALHDLLRQAMARDPAAAALLRQDLPRPGDGFVGRVLAFVLGMAAESAESAPARLFPNLAAHPDARALFERLGDDLQRYARWAEPGAEWRTFVVPVLDGKHLTPFHLYVRDGDARSEAEAAEAGIRFMVDVDLSRLGAIQLDGLYRRRHLALTVRSGRRLPQGFAEPLEEMYERALLAAGMTGELRIESEAVLTRAALAPLLGRHRRIAV